MTPGKKPWKIWFQILGWNQELFLTVFNILRWGVTLGGSRPTRLCFHLCLLFSRITQKVVDGSEWHLVEGCWTGQGISVQFGAAGSELKAPVGPWQRYCSLNFKNDEICDHPQADWIGESYCSTFVRITFPNQSQQWSLCSAVTPRWHSVCLDVSSAASESPPPPPFPQGFKLCVSHWPNKEQEQKNGVSIKHNSSTLQKYELLLWQIRENGDQLCAKLKIDRFWVIQLHRAEQTWERIRTWDVYADIQLSWEITH